MTKQSQRHHVGIITGAEYFGYDVECTRAECKLSPF